MTKKKAIETLLSELFFCNANGVWFFKIPDRDQYAEIPRRLWPVLELLSDAKRSER